MKLLYKRQKTRQQRTTLKAARITAKRKRDLQKKKRRKYRKYQGGTWYQTSLAAPQYFRLDDDEARNALIEFLSKIKGNARREITKIRLDFSETKQMMADATLLFKATLMHLKEENPDVVIKCCPSRNDKINEVLTQIRVLELLGQSFNITPHFEDVIYWKTTEGKGSDGEQTDPILERCDQVIKNIPSRDVYVGLTEAMTNTRQHAYNKAFAASDRTEWWIFSQEKDNILTIAICDLGIGIPKSLPKKTTGMYEWIMERINATKDSELIEGAIRYRMTSTGKSQGKGLTQLTQVIDKEQNAAIYIHSNYGCYAKIGNRTTLRDYDTSVGGTVVLWNLPIYTGTPPT